MRLSTLILAAALSAAAAPTLAAPACSPPAGLTPAPPLTPRPDDVVSGVSVVYYVLALNWTPEWCRSGGSGAAAKEMECATPHGFTLHGLWPDGAAPPYPRFCHPAGQLDAATVRQMYCRTPSAVLLQHEWQAHGTCSNWPDAKAYFGQASQLFDRIVLPKIEAIPKGKLTAGAVRDAFAKANPWAPAGGIYVQGGRKETLSEVRFCYDRAFKPIACPGGAGQENWILLDLAPSLTGAF
jgi:ribonuclease T2